MVKPGPEFGVDVYRVADGQSRRVRLSDQATGWARGDGCFVVYTSDGSARGFRLGETLVGGSCEVTERRQAIWEHTSFTQDQDATVTASFGGDEYRLSFRERGTALVRVSHPASWTRELSAVGTPNVGRAGLVAVPGGVIVFAGLFPESQGDATAVVLRLAADTGRTEWEQRIRDHYNVSFDGAVYDGRYVVAVIGNGMYAFDPESGQIAWHHGP